LRSDDAELDEIAEEMELDTAVIGIIVDCSGFTVGVAEVFSQHDSVETISVV
jgi:hypothetical protein